MKRVALSGGSGRHHLINWSKFTSVMPRWKPCTTWQAAVRRTWHKSVIFLPKTQTWIWSWGNTRQTQTDILQKSLACNLQKYQGQENQGKTQKTLHLKATKETDSMQPVILQGWGILCYNRHYWDLWQNLTEVCELEVVTYQCEFPDLGGCLVDT